MTFFHKKQRNPGICRGRLAQSLRFCLASIVALFLIGRLPAQAPGQPAQYKLEAVFLFNFAQFVEWPATAFPDPETPFTIGVLGKDPFGTILDEIISGETVKGHKLQVERYRNVADVKNCQILFISTSEEARFLDILARLKGQPVLTVGESEGFARKGGAVRFLTSEPKIRLRINIDTLTESKLTASSKLLRLAEIVHSEVK
ncbi:MAG: YfiR family protein [Verrucomicrobiales bacterium]|nr:YfiR family protein [Verrucomicrobiales bacterium]